MKTLDLRYWIYFIALFYR